MRRLDDADLRDMRHAVFCAGLDPTRRAAFVERAEADVEALLDEVEELTEERDAHEERADEAVPRADHEEVVRDLAATEDGLRRVFAVVRADARVRDVLFPLAASDENALDMKIDEAVSEGARLDVLLLVLDVIPFVELLVDAHRACQYRAVERARSVEFYTKWKKTTLVEQLVRAGEDGATLNAMTKRQLAVKLAWRDYPEPFVRATTAPEDHS